MKKVYIIDGGRSFLGIENSMYRHVPAEVLGGLTLRRLYERYDGQNISGVIAGNGVGAGGNIARLMMLEGGLPVEIPASTVDCQCGSGLEAINAAFGRIMCNQGELYFAGGFESSSTAPRRAYHPNHLEYEKYGGEQSFYSVAKFIPGEHRQDAMLQGAERVALAEGMTRESLNPWVIRSHELARKAREERILNDICWEVIEGCNQDEGIRKRMDERFLNRLPCVLKDGQVITAGNACLMNDGAAFLAIASEGYVREYACEPLAEIVDIVQIGSDPMQSPKTAILAIEALLRRQGMNEKDIDIFECNEAFAVIDELFVRRYPEAVERYNVFGGALAYGHPYGASGGIITLHAIKALEKRNGQYGVCSIAAAGGIGTALLIRRL